MGPFRLDFAFQAGSFRLTGISDSGNNPPASDPIVPAATGFWLTVHGGDGRQVHAQILRDPRTGDAHGGQVIDQLSQAFVPDPGRDGFVVFHMAFPAPGEAAFTGARVAVFPLKAGVGLSILAKLRKVFARPNDPVWLLVVGDGFGPQGSALFEGFAADFVARLCAMAPFDGHKDALKARIATRLGPPAEGFGATIDPLEGRLRMMVDGAKVAAYVDQQLKLDPVNVLVVLNDPRYGGSGGDPAVTGLGEPTAQGRGNAIDAAIHELGHSAFALADEYDTHVDGMTTTPVELNVAHDETSVRSKWGTLLHPPGVALPTAATATDDTVGMFRGAKYDPDNNYRAQLGCRMRYVNWPYCAACREVISSVLTSEL